MPVHKLKVKSHQIIVFILSLFIFWISFSNLILFLKNPPQPAIPESTVLGLEDETKNEIAFWQNILKDNPYYLPGWIELTKLQIKQNDATLSIESLRQVKSLSPNSELVDYLEALRNRN